MANITARIKLFLDVKIGPSYDHRVWLGRLSKNESTHFFGVDFGDSLIRITEKDALIQVLRRSSHGNIKEGSTSYKSIAYFNGFNPVASRYETTGKARKAIIQLMTG